MKINILIDAYPSGSAGLDVIVNSFDEALRRASEVIKIMNCEQLMSVRLTTIIEPERNVISIMNNCENRE